MIYTSISICMKRKIQRICNRSGTRVCEICNAKTILIQHHIRGHDITNANHKNNLANICPNCHIRIHSGEIIIEDRLYTTNGYKLIWHLKGENSLTNNDADPWTI